MSTSRTLAQGDGGGDGAGVARNAGAAAGRYALAALLALAVAPYAVGTLGEAGYGVWALAGSVLAAARWLDLGLERAMVRATAGSVGSEDVQDARASLATGRAMLTGMAVLLGLGMAVGHALGLGEALGIPPGLRADAAYVMVGTALVAAIDARFAGDRAALDGIGHMHVSRAIDAGQRIASALGVVLVLGAGFGLRGLVWKNAVTALAAGLALRRALRSAAPDLARAGARPSTAHARELWRFGRHVQAVGVSALVYDAGAKLILARGSGLAALAAFELGLQTVRQAAGALNSVGEALFPSAATIAGRGPNGTGADHHADPRSAPDLDPSSESRPDLDAGRRSELDANTRIGAGRGRDRIRRLARLNASATRYSSWLSLGSLGLLAGLAGPFAEAWLGGSIDPRPVAVVIQLCCAGWASALLAGPAHAVAQASGHARDSSRAAILTAAVALAAVLAMVPAGGAAGAALGVALGLGVGAVYMLLAFARRFEVGLAGLGVPGIRGWLAVALGVAAARAVLAVLPETSARAAGLVAVGSAAVTGAVVIAAALWAGGALTTAERRWLADRWREVVARVTRRPGGAGR